MCKIQAKKCMCQVTLYSKKKKDALGLMRNQQDIYHGRSRNAKL